MQALIFADRLGQELEPLTDRTCVALPEATLNRSPL